MASVEVAEVLHDDWPDSGWVRGYQAIIEPRLHIDALALQASMTDDELPDVDEAATRYVFEETIVAQSNGRTLIFAISSEFHYGTIGSPMHEQSKQSFETRLGFLLKQAGIESPQ